MKVNFGRQLLQVARQFSDRTALVNVEKQRNFSYMDLHLLTNKICNVLTERFNLQLGDVYGNLLENDNNSLFGFWTLKSCLVPCGLIIEIHLKNIFIKSII